MKTKLIGLCGPKGCGKSEVAHKIYERVWPDDVKIISFAGPMKRAIFQMAFNHIYSWDEFLGLDKEKPREELCGKSIRYALQTLGTEWGRNCIGESFWVNAAMREVEEECANVFDDTRYYNEAKAIKARGGLVLQIKRESVYEAGDKHASEAGVSHEFVDYVIDNTGSLDETVDNILEVLD